MTLTELNAMRAPEFVAALGGLFEHSPWVAEGVVAARPFDTAQAAARCDARGGGQGRTPRCRCA